MGTILSWLNKLFFGEPKKIEYTGITENLNGIKLRHSPYTFLVEELPKRRAHSLFEFVDSKAKPTIETNCRNCGAPHDGVKCEHCGTWYKEKPKPIEANINDAFLNYSGVPQLLSLGSAPLENPTIKFQTIYGNK